MVGGILNEKSEEIHMNQFGIGITISGTMWYSYLALVPGVPYFSIITHILDFLRLIRVDFSTKKGVQNQPLIFSLLYKTVISRDQVRKNTVKVFYHTIRSRMILEAYHTEKYNLV